MHRLLPTTAIVPDKIRTEELIEMYGFLETASMNQTRMYIGISVY